MQTKNGETPLHLATVGVIGSLLNRGADPNIVNNDGSTPLHLAAADANAEDHDGNTPLAIARKNYGDDIVSILIGVGGK